MSTDLVPIRLGTRGSPLALAQTEMVAKALKRVAPAYAEPGMLETVVIKTTGDRIQDRALAAAGGKGLFTKEIEEALISGAIDLAVHSMKDVPTRLPDGLVIAAMLPRADPRDVLIGRDEAVSAGGIKGLPRGAALGTASLRRGAQALALRPDLRVTLLRGSVQTRLDKLERGEVDATLLAVAGLERLGLSGGDRPLGRKLGTDEMLPAVAQGAVGVECSQGNGRVMRLLARIDHLETSLAVDAERAFLAALDGSCRTPIAAWCRKDGGAYLFEGLIVRPDGTDARGASFRADAHEAKARAEAAGAELKAGVDEGYLAAMNAAGDWSRA